MAGSDWWADEIPSELCQGDVISELPFYVPEHPFTDLKYSQFSKGRSGYEEHAAPAKNKVTQKYYLLSHYNSLPGLIISHGCEIDKKKSRAGSKRILCAPIVSLGTVPEDAHASILAQEVVALMPLQGIPRIEDGFADLRLTTAIPADLIDDGERVCSMTDEARKRLQVQLVSFYTRRELP